MAVAVKWDQPSLTMARPALLMQGDRHVLLIK